MQLEKLRTIIEEGYERRAEITPQSITPELDEALADSIALLDSGRARVAEKRDGQWLVNQWLKKAVLLTFRASENQVVDAGYTRFYDKVALKYPDWEAHTFRESGVLRDPMTVTPEMTVREVLALQKQHRISGFPVVKAGKVVGIVTNRDLRFETRLEQPVKDIMTPQRRLVTVKEGASREEAMKLMHERTPRT